MEGFLQQRFVTVAKRAGVIGHRRAVDSTGIADSVVTQDTVTLIRSAIRRCLRLLGELVPDKALACRASLSRNDYDSESKPAICWASAEERSALVNDLFTDACRVIIACTALSDPALVAEVKLLALVAAQDVEDDGAGGVRIVQRVGAERVISTVDPDARHGHRSRRDRYDGYKLHVSVDTESDLFVAGEATTATTGDGEVLDRLIEDDPVAVAEVIGDTHYGQRGDTAVPRRGRHRAGVSRLAVVGTRGPLQQGRVHHRPRSGDRHLPGGADGDHPDDHRVGHQARFDADVCATCPLRERCTARAGGRIVEINRYEELLVAARQARWTDEFRERYRERVRVECKNAQLKSRQTKLPRGLTKANAWLQLRMAALNLDRIGRFGLVGG